MIKRENYIKVLFWALLVVGLVAGVILVRQTQELRRGAFFATKKLELASGTGINDKKIGDDILVHLQAVNVGSTGSDIDNIRAVVCYDSSLVDVQGATDSAVTINDVSNNVFNKKYLVNVYSIASRNIVAPTSGSPSPTGSPSADKKINKCVDFTIGTDKPAVNLKNEGEFAVVHLRANAVGSGVVRILKEFTKVSGNNIADPSIQVDSVGDLAYTITGQGTGPVLNFKVAFNLSYPTAKCADWKVQVKVNGKDGSSKTYNDVSLTNTGTANTTNGYTIYNGSLRLVGFNQTSDLAVFIKGPKHLTMKYGVNNQKNFYNQLNGQIGGLTNDPSTSPVFDFSNYPLLAGDVTGGTLGAPDKIQDGVINGVDFSYVKAQTALRVTGGGDLLADLNGDCSLGSIDTGVLVQSLVDKQEQTY